MRQHVRPDARTALAPLGEVHSQAVGATVFPAPCLQGPPLTSIKADANRSRSTARDGAVELRDPQHATRAVREYLAALDEQEEQVTVPASISPTDPGARWTAVDDPAFYACSTNYLIDVQAGIIIDVEATPTLRTAKVKAPRTMIERVEERFDLKPERLIGDMGYGNAESLGWMVNDKGIAPHVPVWDKTQRDATRRQRDKQPASVCRP